MSRRYQIHPHIEHDDGQQREMDEMLEEAHEIMSEMEFWYRAMDGDPDYIAGYDDEPKPEQETNNA